jgi:hypothetical protein
MGKTWSDAYRFRFALPQITREEVASVPSTYAYSGESPAPAWVGAPAGYQAFWQAYGVKCLAVEDIPDDIRKSALETMPALFEGKESWH